MFVAAMPASNHGLVDKGAELEVQGSNLAKIIGDVRKGFQL